MSQCILRSVRVVFGLALAFAAFAGTAQAIDINTVPEMDAGTMGSAMTLFLGGVMLLKSRFGSR
jgi:hypothetical protein